jgi:hypothetical protein
MIRLSFLRKTLVGTDNIVTKSLFIQPKLADPLPSRPTESTFSAYCKIKRQRSSLLNLILDSNSFANTGRDTAIIQTEIAKQNLNPKHLEIIKNSNYLWNFCAN